MKYKVKANESLLNAFNDLAYGFKALGSIIQNDIELNDEDIYKWVYQSGSLINDMKTLIRQTENFILGSCEE